MLVWRFGISFSGSPLYIFHINYCWIFAYMYFFIHTMTMQRSYTPNMSHRIEHCTLHSFLSWNGALHSKICLIPSIKTLCSTRSWFIGIPFSVYLTLREPTTLEHYCICNGGGTNNPWTLLSFITLYSITIQPTCAGSTRLRARPFYEGKNVY